MSFSHAFYMQRCLTLARKGAGRVSPNPMVGALIVVDDIILAEGWHEAYGQAHAEPNAINMLLAKFDNGEELLRKARIYVSLEPCSHFGKTPPCSDLIIRYQIPEVIIGCQDPSEKVSGKGIEKLRKAGIKVICGVLEKECRELNKRFFTATMFQRPYIILKWAETGNGLISPDPYSPLRISSPLSELLVHRWRTEEDCILVGRRTAMLDDPRLTSRHWPGKNPVRAVVDWDLSLPGHLHLFDKEAPTYIFNGQKGGQEGMLNFIHLEFKEYLPQYLLYQLYLMDLHSVIIEGGANLLNQFIRAGLWDEARIFTGCIQFNKGVEAPLIRGVLVSDEQLGPDRLRILKNGPLPDPGKSS